MNPISLEDLVYTTHHTQLLIDNTARTSPWFKRRSNVFNFELEYIFMAFTKYNTWHEFTKMIPVASMSLSEQALKAYSDATPVDLTEKLLPLEDGEKREVWFGIENRLSENGRKKMKTILLC